MILFLDPKSKRLVVLTAILLVSGTQAGFLDSMKDVFGKVGDAFATVGKSLLHNLDTAAGNLLHQATAVGKDLLNQGVQAVAMNTLNALQGDNGGKRDLSAIANKLDHFKNQAVDMLLKGESQMKHVIANVIKGFETVLHKAANFEITPEEITKAVDHIVNSHKILSSQFLKDLVHDTEWLVSQFFGHSKRNGFTDFFSNLGQSLADTFSPVVTGVKNLVTNTGTAIKNAAVGLYNSAKDSVAQLGTKLQPHVDALKQHTATIVQHGVNAVGALKDATVDIFHQTMTNMAPAVSGIIDTAKDAGNTVVNHVAGALTGGANPAPQQ